MTDFIIETNQLTKSFKGQPALRGLDLRVPPGSIFGFLGRNGAGKTTTVKTLMGLLRSDSGTARVFGIRVTDADRSIEVRRRVGFVAEAATEEVLRELVDISASEGTTMFFSSHQLSEVELIADHIGIIDRGRMVASGELDEMKSRYRRLQVVFEGSLELPACWPDGVESVRQEGRVVSILASNNVETIVEQARSLPGTSVESFPVTLKEIFLEHVRSN